jgi:hypothetical protein
MTEPLIHRMVQVADLRFHVVEGGEGPAVVLIAGFPQIWFACRRVMPLLAPHGAHADQPRGSLARKVATPSRARPMNMSTMVMMIGVSTLGLGRASVTRETVGSSGHC